MEVSPVLQALGLCYQTINSLCQDAKDCCPGEDQCMRFRRIVKDKTIKFIIDQVELLPLKKNEKVHFLDMLLKDLFENKIIYEFNLPSD